MKAIINLVTLFLISSNIFCQITNSKEVKIKYSNGLEIFHVYESNPSIIFEEEKKYFWYNADYADVKSTQGGCGGKLLNGNYKFYDAEGNLRVDRNFSQGLFNGNETSWDSIGNIIEKAVYDLGKRAYWKHLSDDDYWVEFNGELWSPGTVKKVYTKFGILISETTFIKPYIKQHVKTYFETSKKQIKEEYTCDFSQDCFNGKFICYYENGNIEVDGQYSDEEMTDIKIGTWTWYERNGEISVQQEYKMDMEKWSNGNLKTIGSRIFDKDSNKWLKNNKWDMYNEDGKYDGFEQYRWGVKIDSLKASDINLN